MSDIALRMERVYKKFTRGEKHDTLRDLIPALTRRALRRVARPLELRDQEFWALRDISFEIRKGESVGIIGHNGAGKSTLLKHLSGIMRPTLGEIEVNGRLSALIEVGAGFHQDLTGRENVFLNGVILGMSRAEIKRKFDEIVDFSGLREFIDTPVKRYSSGMYARLGFAVAAHMEPDILIIDEVLSVGDFLFQTKGLEKMRSVLNSGASVIFVSHNLRAVADLCKRTIMLSKGGLVEDGPTSKVIQTYMQHMRAARTENTGADVVVESVRVRGHEGPRLDFEAGEMAWLDVTLRANSDVQNLDCVVRLKDDRYAEIFNTSSQRLGVPAVSIAAGETRTLTFELQLHLAQGAFHLGVGIYRWDMQRVYDLAEPVASIFIRSPIDVRGAANLYPRAELVAAGGTSEARLVASGA
jgi:lipopolysaccharide transport system ATP-binding protein